MAIALDPAVHADAMAAGAKVGAVPTSAALAARSPPLGWMAWLAGAPLVLGTGLLWVALFVRLRTRRPSEREIHAAAHAASIAQSGDGGADGITARLGAAVSSFGVCQHSVVELREWWRFATAPAVHADVYHLAVNVWGLWALGAIERTRGSGFVLVRSAVLLCTMAAVRLRVWRALKARAPLHWHVLAAQRTVGATGALLGWFMIVKTLEDADGTGGMGEAAQQMPMLSLVVVQLLVRESSPVDATAGVVMGWLVAQGVFDWLLLSYYWTFCFGMGIALALVVSMAATTELRVPGIEIGADFYAEQDEPVGDLL